MKELYYTVRFLDLDGIIYQTKLITIYDIVDNKIVIVAEINALEDVSTAIELEHFVEYDLQEDSFETHLDKDSTFFFTRL